MNDLVIVYRRDGDEVSIVHPGWADRGETESAAEFLARVIKRAVPSGAECKICRLGELPAYDSATRDRWRWQDGAIVVTPSLEQPPRQSDNSLATQVQLLQAQVAALRDHLAAGAAAPSEPR